MFIQRKPNRAHLQAVEPTGDQGGLAKTGRSGYQGELPGEAMLLSKVGVQFIDQAGARDKILPNYWSSGFPQFFLSASSSHIASVFLLSLVSTLFYFSISAFLPILLF